MTTLIIIIIIALILLCGAAIAINRRQFYTAHQAFVDTKNLLIQAEATVLRDDLDLALVLYGAALDLAPKSGCALFQAEAHYGMARVYQKRGQLQFAGEELQNALANRQDWQSEKPKFALLIEKTLADVNASLGR